MAKLFLVGSYSQKGLKAIVGSGFDRHIKTRKAVEDMGLKFISYDIVRGKYDFVVTVEGEWEQVVGLVAAANASGDMDEACENFRHAANLTRNTATRDWLLAQASER